MAIDLIAPAKLTLSLRVAGVRDDGFHLIDAEMVTLDLYDTLRVELPGQGFSIEGGGADVPVGDDNLVVRALALTGRSAAIHLRKRIPSQAGLGGGSADAGAVLRWAGFDDLEAAGRLGADVPFCRIGGRARVRGIGEIVEPLAFEPRPLTLLVPPLACPTPAVFRAWDELGGPVNDESPNDLEAAAVHVVPELARWRDEFAVSTGRRPTMAGSGATWFVDGHHPGPRRLLVRTTPADWSPLETDDAAVDDDRADDDRADVD